MKGSKGTPIILQTPPPSPLPFILLIPSPSGSHPSVHSAVSFSHRHYHNYHAVQMGRRKIEIQPLTDDRNRTVTFVKRKAGLFKKAHELAVLCQVDLAVIIVGANNKVYEFSSVDTNELIADYQRKKLKIHESKGPEHYGNYVKKRSLSEALTRKPVDQQQHDESSEDELAPESPEPKRVKVEDDPYRRPIIPYRDDAPPVVVTQPQPTNTTTTATPNPPQRPVLRVQIPTEPLPQKLQPDSGKTITAQLTTGGTDAKDEKPSLLVPPVSKYTNYTSFRLPDSRKPPVLLPIHATATKSQLLLPLDVSAPGPLPASYYQPVVVGMLQSLPLTILPTPLVNQVFASTMHPQYNRVLYALGDTPVGLRYPLGDIFPLPLNFYPPHDWQMSTGMTPLQGQPPLTNAAAPAAPAPSLGSGPPSSFPNLASILSFGKTIQAVQQRDSFPSPLQYNSSFQDKEK